MKLYYSFYTKVSMGIKARRVIRPTDPKLGKK